MDRACGMHGEKRNSYSGLVEVRRDHYKDLDLHERIIIKWILER
jgi:hypothetical protein